MVSKKTANSNKRNKMKRGKRKVIGLKHKTKTNFQKCKNRKSKSCSNAAGTRPVRGHFFWQNCCSRADCKQQQNVVVQCHDALFHWTQNSYKTAGKRGVFCFSVRNQRGKESSGTEREEASKKGRGEREREEAAAAAAMAAAVRRCCSLFSRSDEEQQWPATAATGRHKWRWAGRSWSRNRLTPPARETTEKKLPQKQQWRLLRGGQARRPAAVR